MVHARKSSLHSRRRSRASPATINAEVSGKKKKKCLGVYWVGIAEANYGPCPREAPSKERLAAWRTSRDQRRASLMRQNPEKVAYVIVSSFFFVLIV